MAPTQDPFEAAKGAAEQKTPSSPVEGTKDAAEGSESKNAATGGVGHGEGDDEAEGEKFATARPDNIPEKFWDKEKGELNQAGLLKSYGELEKQLTEAKKPPKAPENYEYKVPEKLTKDFGLKEVAKDDPYLVGFNQFAKSKGYTQEQYQEFVDFYLDMELNEANKTMVSEFGKLGDQATAIKRVKVLNTFAANKLSPESAQTMNQLAKTAAGVKLFEELIAMSTKSRNTVDDDPKVSGDLSEEELNAMMLTDEYNDPKHPNYNTIHAKVKKEFERLYPSKKG